MVKKILAMAAAVVVVAGGYSPSAKAQGNNEENKVTICHRTDSVKNPYVRITVDKSAADGEAGNSGGQADHFGEHKGPVATSEAVAQGFKDDKTEWGDIIPPVEGSHGGLNWTTQGRAIYNNDCKYAASRNPVTPTDGGDDDSSARTSEGGRGGAGSAQVQSVPKQGVNAGGGGGETAAEASAIAGLMGSIAALGYGLFRLRKSSI